MVGRICIADGRPGRIAPHYFLLAVPPLTMLAAPTFNEAFQRTGFRRRRMALLVVGVGLLISTVVGSVVTQRYFDRFPNRDQVSTVAAWVRANTTADATIFAWETSRTFTTLRIVDPPRATPSCFHLRRPDTRLSSRWKIWSSISYSAPTDSHHRRRISGAWGTRLDATAHSAVCRASRREGLDILEPLRAFVRQQYHLAEIVDGWPVYLHNEARGTRMGGG